MDTQLEANLARVTFIRTAPRDIISPHSFCILADEEPVTALEEHMHALILQAFIPKADVGKPSKTGKGTASTAITASHEVLTPMESLNRSNLVQALVRCGFPFAENQEYVVDTLVQRWLGDQSSFSVDEFTSFLTKFQAPSYYYGERLRKAASRGQVKLVTEYIVRGCNVNTADGDRQTSLHYACTLNQVEVIETMVNICDKQLVLSPTDNYGCTPLWLACYFGSTESVLKMISLDADVNAFNSAGASCLHAAASKGHTDICKLLIKAGAKYVVDVTGMYPIHIAALHLADPMRTEVIQVLAANTSEEGKEEAALGDEYVDALGYSARHYRVALGD
jgi:hypothetical protein